MGNSVLIAEDELPLPLLESDAPGINGGEFHLGIGVDADVDLF
jgi:hypothetical protein